MQVLQFGTEVLFAVLQISEEILLFKIIVWLADLNWETTYSWDLTQSWEIVSWIIMRLWEWDHPLEMEPLLRVL